MTNFSFDYGVGRETRNLSGDEGGKVVFTLPAKRKYSASFDVELEHGKMENVSSDYFSKMLEKARMYVVMSFVILCSNI